MKFIDPDKRWDKKVAEIKMSLIDDSNSMLNPDVATMLLMDENNYFVKEIELENNLQNFWKNLKKKKWKKNSYS